MNNTTIKVSFDENGYYFVTCPDCEDDRAQFVDENPSWDISGCVPCKLCRGSGDLCVTILIEKTDTSETLEAKIEARREEVAV